MTTWRVTSAVMTPTFLNASTQTMFVAAENSTRGVRTISAVLTGVYDNKRSLFMRPSYRPHYRFCPIGCLFIRTGS